jgi:MFS family permease
MALVSASTQDAVAQTLPRGDCSEELVLSYEEALALVGTGVFQRRTLWLCGLGNAADAVELLVVSLVLPAVGPDGASLRLSVPQLASLSAALFWGAMVGTLAWGVFSDAVGRRKALSAAMAIAAGFGLLSAVAGSFATLVLCRTLAGIGVGGSIPVVYAWLSEVLTPAARGKYMVLLASSWMVGSICTAIAGLAIVPSHPVTGWRWFLAFAALPSAICGLWAQFAAPESPRWLLSRGRGEEAMALLRKAAIVNGCEGAIPPHATLALPSARVASADAPRGSALLASQWRTISSLFSRPMRATSLALCFVWFGISCGWYGTVLWFPE